MKNEHVKFRFFNMLYVLALVLASIAVAPALVHAQEGEFRTMLPVINTGAQIAQPIDGPFHDRELPEPDFDFTEVESGGEITAAASCYDSLQVNELITTIGWTDYYYSPTTSNCRDLNVQILTISNSCRVYVQSYWFNGNDWIMGSRSHLYFEPNRWYEPITNLRDNVWTATAVWTENCGIHGIKIAL